jgi:hypothetical protein
MFAHPLSSSESLGTFAVRTVAVRTIKGKGKVMSDSGEFAVMSDPDFLDERRRVREALEVLAERYRLINIEFDRRAGAKWAAVS